MSYNKCTKTYTVENEDGFRILHIKYMYRICRVCAYATRSESTYCVLGPVLRGGGGGGGDRVFRCRRISGGCSRRVQISVEIQRRATSDLCSNLRFGDRNFVIDA